MAGPARRHYQLMRDQLMRAVGEKAVLEFSRARTLLATADPSLFVIVDMGLDNDRSCPAVAEEMENRR
jgi:hypothetical protein